MNIYYTESAYNFIGKIPNAKVIKYSSATR